MLCRLSLWVASTVLATSWLAHADEPKGSPLNGTWSWQWKDADGIDHRHILEVEGAAGSLAARERFDDLPAVKVDDLKLKGTEVRFSVTRDQKRSEYQGKLTQDDTINGTVSVAVKGQQSQYGWTARKSRPSEKGNPRSRPARQS